LNAARGAGNLRAMNLFAVLLACLALFAGAARGESINGRSYLSLATWAKANGFKGFARNGGTEYVLTNKTSRLLFKKDSVESTINGVNVRLSYPVAKGGYISQLDADKTLRPLIFPQRPLPKKITTICLDPGHGGKDVGYRVGHFWNARNEKTYTLALALELRRQLRAAGFNVVMTRDKDVYPELAERADIANRSGADLFIVMHFNCFTGDPSAVQGPETYCMTPVGAASSNDSAGAGAGSRAYPANRVEEKSLLLAYQVQRALVKNLGATDRSVRRARYEVMRLAQMPTAYIEGGYMSNPAEGKKIFSEEYRKQMAAAIVRAVVSYKKLVDPVTPTTVASTNKISTVKKRR
jgi:N-acetylmuramoyl-L-alanine amidase